MEQDNVELVKVVQNLEKTFARMTKTFRSMETGELREGFRTLAKLSKEIQRNLHEFAEAQGATPSSTVR